MKTLITAALLAASATGAFAGTENGRDTIVVKLKKADKLMLITRPGQQGVRGLQEYDINQILRRVDSTLRASQTMTLTEGRDTTFVINRIQTFKEGGNDGDKKTIAISVNTKNGGPSIIIRERYEDPDTVYHKENKPGKHRRHKRFQRGNDLYVNLGINGYLDKDGKTPDGAGNALALRPLGSRYIAIGYNWAHQFGNSPFGVNTGLEVAWQNFMLEDNYQWFKGPTGVQLLPIGGDTSVSKSKLVQSMVKIPVTLNIAFSRDWSLELGGFGGYRLGSHSKLKYSYEGRERKDKDFNNFYLNNFQYGLKAQIRYKGLGIFAEYHGNELFNSSGPDLTAYQFGIRL